MLRATGRTTYFTHIFYRLQCFLFLVLLTNGAAAQTLEEWQEQLEDPALSDSARVNVLANIGVALFAVDLDSAKATFIESARIAHNLEMYASSGNAFKNVGVTWYFNRNNDSAIHYYERSIEEYLNLPPAKELAEVYRSLGICYFEKGAYSRSVEIYFNAMAILDEEKDSVGLAKLHNSIGTSLETLGELEQSLEHYRQSLLLKTALQDSAGTSVTLMNIGSIHRQQGSADSAIFYQEKALSIAKELKRSNYIVSALVLLAASYEDAGFYTSAEAALIEALSYYSEGEEGGFELSNAYLALASIYMRDQRFDRAENLIVKNIELAEKIGALDNLKNALKQYAEVNYEQGDHRVASDAYRRYETLKDTLFTVEKAKNVTEIHTRYESERKELENQKLKVELDLKNQQIELKTSRQYLLYGGVAVLGLILLGILIALYQKNKVNRLLSDQNVRIKEQREEIQIQKEELAEKNRDITDSITYASRIQRAILPQENALHDYFEEAFVFYRPRDIVSGDFYWVKERGDSLIVACADCTGHGVPGALMSMVGHVLLNELNNTEKPLAPERVLTALDIQIKKVFRQKTSEYSGDGIDLTIMEINKNKRTIQWSSARSVVMVVKDGVPKAVKGSRFSVGGGIYHKKKFEAHSMELDAGDSVYLFTDGLPDQFGGEGGKKLKMAGVTEWITKVCQLPMKEQQSLINSRFDAWKGDLEQTDDVCLLGLRL